MKPAKKIAVILSGLMLIQGCAVFAYDTSFDSMWNKAHRFASRYDFREGDSDKSINLYHAMAYTSGIEKREDGTEYECPAVYNDDDAKMFGSYELQKGEMGLTVNGKPSEYGSQCVLYNGITLVPYSVFKDLDCTVNFDSELYLITISRNETTLEIIPHLIGMRKNKAEGYYVPLEVCARAVDDVFYVPVRAVASELGINVGWNGASHTVTLDSK